MALVAILLVGCGRGSVQELHAGRPSPAPTAAGSVYTNRDIHAAMDAPTLTAAANPTATSSTATVRALPPTPRAIADCFVGVTICAWHDLDRDGRPDPGEPPLPGVVVDVLGWSSGKRTTDDNGEASYFAVTGCPPPDIVVVAASPAGYTPTTPSRVSRGGFATAEPTAFGFAAELP